MDRYLVCVTHELDGIIKRYSMGFWSYAAAYDMAVAHLHDATAIAVEIQAKQIKQQWSEGLVIAAYTRNADGGFTNLSGSSIDLGDA